LAFVTKREFMHFRTDQAEEAIDVTGKVADIVSASGVLDGMVLVFPLHTTAAVYVSDSESQLTVDTRAMLARLVPAEGTYLHDTAELKKNASAHMRAHLAGHHVVLPITKGTLDLGTFQKVYYLELDGRREKEVMLKIMGTDEQP
jgi:secondary thiamine-phosphate synthase enzyme